MKSGDIPAACEIQYAADAIIYKMCACKGNLYAVMKEILKIREGLDLGSVRKPKPGLAQSDMPCVKECADMITAAVEKYC